MSYELTLSPRQERSIAVVLVAVPIVAVLAVLAGLAVSWWTHHEAVAGMKHERAVYESRSSEVPALSTAVARLRDARAAQGDFYPNEQASDAAARMKVQIAQIAASGGATVQRSDVRLAASGDGPTELHAEIAFQADIKALSAILYRIRRAKPLLFVTQLSVHSSQGSAPLAAPNRLQVEIAAKAFVSPP